MYIYEIEIFNDAQRWQRVNYRARAKSAESAMAQFFRSSRVGVPNFTAVRASCDPCGGVK